MAQKEQLNPMTIDEQIEFLRRGTLEIIREEDLRANFDLHSESEVSIKKEAVNDVER